jgi:hypothetical protein
MAGNNVSVVGGSNVGKELNIEIITVIFIYPVLLGRLPLIGPAFDTARLDIAKLYPKLNITQFFVKSSGEFRTCFDWSGESDSVLANFYYHRRIISADEPFTMFLIAGENSN